MHASHLVWAAARHPTGWPEDDVRDSVGRPILPQRGPAGACAGCGAPAAWRMADAISDNVLTVLNAHRAWGHGGDRVCAACLFVCRSIPLRATLWFAAPGRGVFFVGTRPLPGLGGADSPWRRPDPLGVLLRPPAPPFVAGWGWMGIDKGGESHAQRAWWPGAAVPAGQEPLVRLQAKHVGLYARVAFDADRYPLQVDDGDPILVDVPRWTRLRDTLAPLVAEARAAGVYASEIRAALLAGMAPTRCPLRLRSRWMSDLATTRDHLRAPWWTLFVEIFPV